MPSYDLPIVACAAQRTHKLLTSSFRAVKRLSVRPCYAPPGPSELATAPAAVPTHGHAASSRGALRGARLCVSSPLCTLACQSRHRRWDGGSCDPDGEAALAMALTSSATQSNAPLHARSFSLARFEYRRGAACSSSMPSYNLPIEACAAQRMHKLLTSFFRAVKRLSVRPCYAPGAPSKLATVRAAVPTHGPAGSSLAVAASSDGRQEHHPHADNQVSEGDDYGPSGGVQGDLAGLASSAGEAANHWRADGTRESRSRTIRAAWVDTSIDGCPSHGRDLPAERMHSLLTSPLRAPSKQRGSRACVPAVLRQGQVSWRPLEPRLRSTATLPAAVAPSVEQGCAARQSSPLCTLACQSRQTRQEGALRDPDG